MLFLRWLLQPVVARMPAVRALFFSLVDAAAQLLLRPFRLTRPATDTRVAAALLEQTDHLNQLAEDYYANHADADHLLRKPFSEPEALSRRLIDVGVLLDGLRLQPGQTVLELGSGTCWLSHMLNRFGCPTISIDVSPTAIALGRRFFTTDPYTNWQLNPQFLAYDGRRLPLETGSIDRVVVYDAFHHVPNQAELLGELRRVLRDDGIVAMSEPGRGHSRSASSIAEAAATGVLENELAIEDLAELALGRGFAAARLAVHSNAPLLEIDATELRRFMGGRGFAGYWHNLCAALDGHHYLLLFAGDPRPTTRQPRRLNAVIRMPGRSPASVPHSQEHRLAFQIHNAGDTTWLCSREQAGWTRLGLHLYRDDQHRTLVNYDWVRDELSNDVPPGGNVVLATTLPPIDNPGDYVIVVDLVIEGVTWFADRGSVPLQLAWHVE